VLEMVALEDHIEEVVVLDVRDPACVYAFICVETKTNTETVVLRIECLRGAEGPIFFSLTRLSYWSKSSEFLTYLRTYLVVGLVQNLCCSTPRDKSHRQSPSAWTPQRIRFRGEYSNKTIRTSIPQNKRNRDVWPRNGPELSAHSPQSGGQPAHLSPLAPARRGPPPEGRIPKAMDLFSSLT
jgi:hypothetical protein